MKRRHDAASYLLGELDAEEAAAFERALDADPQLREAVERLRPVVRDLEGLPSSAWEPAPPPPLAIPAPAPRGARFALRPVTAVLAAVVLLALGTAAGVLLARAGSRDQPPAARVVLRPVDAGDSETRGQAALAAGRSIELEITGLPPAGPDRFYQLWLLGDDGRVLSLAAFTPDARGHAAVQAPLPVQPRTYDQVDVSLEPSDGDPSHSGASVLRGDI